MLSIWIYQSGNLSLGKELKNNIALEWSPLNLLAKHIPSCSKHEIPLLTHSHTVTSFDAPGKQAF